MAGFVLLPVHGEFIAHKSLTFFPGGFLALGTGITTQVEVKGTHAGGPDAEHPVQTTLLQWAAPEQDAAFVVDVSLSTPTDL